jgi:hypothetical protein
MPHERCAWLSPCSKFPTIKLYEDTPNGVHKTRPFPNSNNDSWQGPC